MKKYWKQLEEWVIGSKDDLFKSARLKLTVSYFAIIAAVLVVFSIILYFFLSQILTANSSNDHLDPTDPGDLVIIQTIDRMRVDIIVIDIISVIATSGLSYSLAGKTLKPIRKAMEKQKEFSANASHELRTPLAIMKTDSEVALRNHHANNSELRNVIESNLEEVNRISQITENLLKLSRVESEGKEVFLSKIDLSQLVSDIVNKMKPLAKSREITIDFKKQDAGQIMGNSGYLESMVFNLVQNGINYNKSGGKINIKIESDKKNVWLTIQDNGIGISKKDLPHIFERFYKSDKSHGQNFSGAGIGLSIVKETVDKHNGSIEIESTPGLGTEFTITFPMASV